MAPDASTFHKVLARLDAATLDRLVGAFLWTRTHLVEGRRVIAIDGKTVRGARTATTTAPHLVSAFDHATGTVVGQLATTAKSNEIPTVRTLLAGFDLTGVVVTVDAMHTQTDTATAIIDGHGDYAFTVKANQPTLYTACKQLPWREVAGHSAVTTTHGRRVRRTIKVVAAPAWITFARAAQVALIRRTTTRAGKTTVEVVYVITSADHRAAPPAVLATWIQGHRGIENHTHWVRSPGVLPPKTLCDSGRSSGSAGEFMRQPCHSFNEPRPLSWSGTAVGAARNVTAPIDPSGPGEAVLDAAVRRQAGSLAERRNGSRCWSVGMSRTGTVAVRTVWRTMAARSGRDSRDQLRVIRSTCSVVAVRVICGPGSPPAHNTIRVWGWAQKVSRNCSCQAR
jgi:predicted transposase YbfD/YdcC